MINNSLFKLGEFPNYHPIINKYERIAFAQQEKRKCMEGLWVAGKWMPGELYYYINFHHINLEHGTYKGLGLPFLRDIDWELFYIFTEAIGFSGFELDEEYTCHRGVKEVEDGDKTLDEMILEDCTVNGQVNEQIKSSILKKDGTLKKYVDAREYLPKLHKAHLGKPLYFNQAKHLLNLSSRGWGKSMSASGMIAWNFLFDGCHDFDEYITHKKDGNMLKSETNVGSGDAKYSTDLMDKVFVALENLPGSFDIFDGKDTVKYDSLFMKKWKGSFAVSKTVTSLCSDSKINHRTLADNPLIFNGTRPNRAFIDEVGFLQTLLEAWEAIETTQAAESVKRLTMYGMGTGGLTAGGAAMYAHEIFYNPEQYGCLVFDDKWENKGNIGFFLPATKALNKYKEGPNMISNEERALAAIEKERALAKKSPTRTRLMAVTINKPLVPSEIFLRKEGTFFPVADLRVRQGDLEQNKILLSSFYKYELDLVNNKIRERMSDKHPIREFPMKRGYSMDAPIEVFERPKLLADGSIPHGRYLAGWDVIDHDGNEDIKQSLQSLFILDSWTDRIVAEYTARTYLVEEYYEQARRLLIMYNATCNYESNKKGPYAYFKNKNSLHLLCETPEILKDMQVIKSTGVGNKSLGTNTNDRVTAFGLNLLLSYYEKQAYGKEEGIRNLDICNSLGLIKESISYSSDINTDRVSAMIMLMILREDRYKLTQISKADIVKTRADDKFWRKNFKKKRR